MKDDTLPLHDILREIAFLHSIRERSTFESFKENGADVRAASYSILVISEAVRRIPADWIAAYPETPWQAIRTIGNKLRHEYQRISDVIVWGIVAEHSDTLKATITDMLAKHAKQPE